MSDGGQWSFILSGPDETAQMETLSQSGVTVPLRINPGDSWSQETNFHLSSASVSGDGQLLYEFNAIGAEEVTVPAGTYQAMRVDITADAIGSVMTVHYCGTAWWVAEFGRVKQIGETRVDEADAIGATVELESYTNP